MNNLFRTTLLGIASVSILLGSLGCATTNSNQSGFENEEYVWENWSVSTNTISIIEVNF